MIVYSGKCALCETGVLSPLKTLYGDNLYTGDIVIIYTYDVETETICTVANHLTVVVNNTSEYNRSGNPESGMFVMGIANTKPIEVDGLNYLKGDDSTSHWCVSKVKSYKDVIHGEHWKDYGFSYSDKEPTP